LTAAVFRFVYVRFCFFAAGGAASLLLVLSMEVDVMRTR
jgi:hypothetical protein